jgi:hypothetical protein
MNAEDPNAEDDTPVKPVNLTANCTCPEDADDELDNEIAAMKS